MKNQATTDIIKRVLFVDQLDSFTYNIVDMLLDLGVEVDIVDAETIQNQQDTFFFITQKLSHIDGVVLGPGPGKPTDYPYLEGLLGLIEEKKLPVLGICLGLQSIASHFGWQVTHANKAIHGKSSAMFHSKIGLFTQVESPTQVGRYHSLVVSPRNNTAIELGEVFGELEVVGLSENSEIMAIRHVTLPIFAVQFHPESVLTNCGKRMIASWVSGL